MIGDNAMHILYLTNIPAPYKIDYYNELGKLCKLTVVFENDTAQNRNDSWYGTEFNNFEGIFLKKGIRVSEQFFFKPEITKYLRSLDPDITVVAGYSSPTSLIAIRWLKRKRRLFGIEIDGALLESENRIKHLIKSRILKAPSFCIGSGGESKKFFNYHGVNNNKIYTSCFSSLKGEDILQAKIPKEEIASIRSKLGLSDKKLVILSVGQFIYRKGFDILFKSARLIDPSLIQICVVGGTPTEEYLRLSSGIDVVFAGFKSKEEILDYYKAADIFVLPTRHDSWGLVINEAMANGIPVITTNKCVAGLELISNGVNGYIVSVDDVDELRNKICTLIEDELLLKKMGRNALNTIQKSTIEEMANCHFVIFEKILEKNGKQI